jgi:hypothetical protein
MKDTSDKYNVQVIAENSIYFPRELEVENSDQDFWLAFFQALGMVLAT